MAWWIGDAPRWRWVDDERIVRWRRISLPHGAEVLLPVFWPMAETVKGSVG